MKLQCGKCPASMVLTAEVEYNARSNGYVLLEEWHFLFECLSCGLALRLVTDDPVLHKRLKQHIVKNPKGKGRIL
jgi:RNase P subunit RPR2